jgi:hypothetical protein
MATKQYFLIIDTETTITNTVADFAAVIVDRKGEIAAECAILVKGEFDAKELFFDVNSSEEIWTKIGLEKRHQNYVNMLNSGQRMMASANAINRWLDKAVAKYNPELTAYNLPFDLDKCQNTGIDLSMFNSRFCLWQLSVGHFAKSKDYRRFALNNHAFNSPTKLGNMTYKTNAEIMASFVSGQMLPPEPHTALEDIKFYELPILQAIMKKKKWREKAVPYNWQEFQVKDNFTV